MLPPQCLFCGHANPADAKFCNGCASPLHLKPCNRCEAVNDRVATTCYKCGARFPSQFIATDAKRASPVPEASTAPSSSSGSGFEHGHTHVPQSAAQILNVPRVPLRNEATIYGEQGVEVIALGPRPLRGHMTHLFPAVRRAADLVPSRHVVATGGQHRISSAVPYAILVAAVVTSAFFVYRDSPYLRDWFAADPGHTPSSSSSAKIDPPPATSPATGVGTANVSAAGAARPESSARSETEVLASPAAQGRIRTASPDAENDPTAAPEQFDAASRLQPSTSTEAQATAAQPLATPRDAVERAPRTAAIAAASRDKSIQTTGERISSKQRISNRSTTTYPVAATASSARPQETDSRVNVPSDARPVAGCTEAVVALGFCGPSTQGEGK